MTAPGERRAAAADLGFVHRFVPAAAGRSPSAPTLLLLHGTGGDEEDLIPLGRALDPAAALLSPRGNVLERGMPRFFRRLAEGVFDQEDLARRTGELARFVRDAAREYGFDPGSVVAVGFSNGANIAASVLLRQPGVLHGAALLSPMLPFEPERTPDVAGVPVFIGAGRLDPIAPAATVERLAEVLRGGGAAVELYWTRGGHTLTPDEVDAARRWLAGLGARRTGA